MPPRISVEIMPRSPPIYEPDFIQEIMPPDFIQVGPIIINLNEIDDLDKITSVDVIQQNNVGKIRIIFNYTPIRIEYYEFFHFDSNLCDSDLSNQNHDFHQQGKQIIKELFEEIQKRVKKKNDVSNQKEFFINFKYNKILKIEPNLVDDEIKKIDIFCTNESINNISLINQHYRIRIEYRDGNDTRCDEFVGLFDSLDDTKIEIKKLCEKLNVGTTNNNLFDLTRRKPENSLKNLIEKKRKLNEETVCLTYNEKEEKKELFVWLSSMLSTIEEKIKNLKPIFSTKKYVHFRKCYFQSSIDKEFVDKYLNDFQKVHGGYFVTRYHNSYTFIEIAYNPFIDNENNFDVAYDIFPNDFF